MEKKQAPLQFRNQWIEDKLWWPLRLRGPHLSSKDSIMAHSTFGSLTMIESASTANYSTKSTRIQILCFSLHDSLCWCHYLTIAFLVYSSISELRQIIAFIVLFFSIVCYFTIAFCLKCVSTEFQTKFTNFKNCSDCVRGQLSTVSCICSDWKAASASFHFPILIRVRFEGEPRASIIWNTAYLDEVIDKDLDAISDTQKMCRQIFPDVPFLILFSHFQLMFLFVWISNFVYMFAFFVDFKSVQLLCIRILWCNRHLLWKYSIHYLKCMTCISVFNQKTHTNIEKSMSAFHLV